MSAIYKVTFYEVVKYRGAEPDNDSFENINVLADDGEEACAKIRKQRVGKSRVIKIPKDIDPKAPTYRGKCVDVIIDEVTRLASVDLS